MFFCYRIDSPYLQIDLISTSLKQNSAKSHFGGVEAHYFSDEILLGRIDGLMQFALLLCFQSHPKNELFVIHQSNTSRPDSRLRD